MKITAPHDRKYSAGCHICVAKNSLGQSNETLLNLIPQKLILISHKIIKW